MADLIKEASSKCVLEGHGVTCFGDTWKEDLLPIESHSLERLYISKCTEQRPHLDIIDMNFLKNVTKLTLLSLTHCELSRPPHVNYQINSIETIDLSNNLIDTNAQFPVLGLDFFKQFPNLKVLNLTNNKLTHLPKSWFDCPSRLEIVILDGNLIGGLNPSLAGCFINLKQLSLKQNKFQRLRMPSESRRLPNNGMKIKEVSGLKLFAEQNNMIRKGDKKENPKGEKLSRRHDFLGVIPQFKSLESLDLAYNKIQSIDQIPLSNLENLIRLNLAHNHLSSKLLSGLSENECDFGTAPFYITSKIGLSELDLSNNHDLTRIHNCWTFGLQNLKILKMINCSISHIYESSFDKMKALSVLDLSFNNLSSVPKEIIVVAKTLTWLSLAQNNISQLSSSFISSLENLRFLNLSHNRYQNLMSFSVLDSESKLSESIADIQGITRESSSDEPIHLLSQMKDLKEIDLSFNYLNKISAVNDLSPSIKPNGGLRKIDLRGNPTITQFVDFNSNDITTTLSKFLINDDMQLICDCLLVGFIKWIHLRQIEIGARCSSPLHLSHLSISSPQLLEQILNDKSCKEVSSSVSFKTTYRLKLFSNANVSQDFKQSDNDPMDDGQKKSINQKQQVDFQKWVMTGSNITLRCEFLTTYPIDFPINIEWQRLKLKPFDSGHYSSQENQQNSLFLKNEKLERLDNMKYREKIEYLNSNYDTRIKITQIGPVSEDTVVAHIFNTEEVKNIPIKRKDAAFKYVGFLILQPVLFNDIGRYRCLINGLPTLNLYGQNQLISKEENIKIFTPPRFTSTPTNPMAIIEGETAEITCRAVGNPLPLTSLGRIGSKDFPAARGRRMTMYKDDSSFFITNVRQVDAGNYSCTSRNVAGTISHNFTLKVQMPANILNKIQPRKTVRVGEALIIGFKVDGIPLPGVKWYKDDKDIFENERIRFSSDQLMLIIQSTILTDAGIYKISVLNALGGNDAYVTVDIIDSQGRAFHAPSKDHIKDKSPTANQDKDQSWIPDYWLSGIIIIVILSILFTSILWITVFFCFTKIIGSKKRRILRISNSMSRNSFDKTINTATTSFSNTRIVTSSIFKPLTECSIPLSLTTSTIVPHDQDNTDIDTFTDCTKTPSEFYSPQLFHNCLPYTNNRFLSQPYLSNSGIDLSNKVSQSSSNSHQHHITDTCDSGIDSSQIYSETINSSDIPSMYQCRHKSKHRTNHQKQRKRYMCSNSSDSSEAMKSKIDNVSNDDVEERLHLDISNNDTSREIHEVRP